VQYIDAFRFGEYDHTVGVRGYRQVTAKKPENLRSIAEKIELGMLKVVDEVPPWAVVRELNDDHFGSPPPPQPPVQLTDDAILSKFGWSRAQLERATKLNFPAAKPPTGGATLGGSWSSPTREPFRYEKFVDSWADDVRALFPGLKL
jgi:hypothetical protein